MTISEINLRHLQRRKINVMMLQAYSEKHKKVTVCQTDEDCFSLVALLKACTKTKNLSKGTRLHADILKRGLLQKSPHLANTLICMYAKCGVIAKAQKLLDDLPVRNITSWNALIAGYAQHGRAHDALDCLERLQNEGFSANAVTFICILKACSSKGTIDIGMQIHDELISNGLLWTEIFIGNALVDMYAKCGALAKAQEVMESLPVRDVVTWNALITGYAFGGKWQETLDCFEWMQIEAIPPDAVTFVSVLKACGSIGLVNKGKWIHEELMNRKLLENHAVLGTALVDMYSKCGLIRKAQDTLEELPARNIITWSALIAGCVQLGQCHEALNCFERMHGEGFSPNAVTFISMLKACGKMNALKRGKQIHNKIICYDLLKENIFLGHTLVEMYITCGAFSEALSVLEELPVQDIVPWNAIIAAHAEQGTGHDAVKCYERMKSKGLAPDAVTFIYMLKACCNTGSIEQGRKVHADILSRGLLTENIALGTALVDMYAKCGALAKAKQVLEELPARNTASWNALIAGYSQTRLCHEVLIFFEKMQSEGILPDVITFTCVLKACGRTASIEDGKWLHQEILRRGLLYKDPMIGTSLVDLYVKCGMLEKAEEVLKELPARDTISWNVLVEGYAQQAQVPETLNCVKRMKDEGISPDSMTFISIWKACSSTGAIEAGQKLHDEIINVGLLETDVKLGNALVDMYAKFGMLEKAQHVLEELPHRDIVSWSALIAGYAQQGQAHEALFCLEQMQNEGISPNAITFLSILSACTHAGILDLAQTLYANMAVKYGITPSVEHHVCMVVIFGSAGYFDAAISVIRAMPPSDYSALWLALLSACGKWGNAKLGKLTFDQIIQLEEHSPTAYGFMADIFVAAGMLEDAEKVEALIQTCVV